MLPAKPRTRPDYSLENAGEGQVCGIDEVGRAPLAGPVVAACVLIPQQMRQHKLWFRMDDSKKLSRGQREELFPLIREAAPHGIGMASVEEIETLNIHHASLLAMRRAYLAMQKAFAVKARLALVDGKFSPSLPCAVQTVIKGDAKSISIAAASIVAKVTRDRLMTRLHAEHPVYGWDRNVGYPTPEHLRALSAYGVTAHHRMSFSPCGSPEEAADLRRRFATA